MKKRNLLRKKSGSTNPEISLNITAMADIFTVLLVFMLKGYTTGAESLMPSSNVRLPAANTEVSQIEALKIEITPDAFVVEGQPVTQLKGFVVADAEAKNSGASQSLTASLAKVRAKQKAISAANSAVQNDSRIVIIADEKAPYKTIKSALASAALQGYTDFKLAVVSNNP